MFGRIRSRPVRGVVIALAGGVLAASLISMPAAAAPAPPLTPPRVRVDPAATIRAQGAAAVVALDVACFGQPVRTLEVDVEQTRADGSTVASAGYASITHCGRTPQRVLAPLQGNYCTENSFCGSAGPIRPGPATVGVYYHDCNDTACNDHFYPRAPAVLTYSPALDHRTSPSLTIGRYGKVVQHGTAAYVYLHATCSEIAPGANAGQASLTQTVARSVTYAQPNRTTSPVCAPHPVHSFRVLMVGGPLRPGPAYVLYDDLSAVVTLL